MTNKSFTTIEVLVVIGVTSLITGILIIYNRASERQIILFRERAKIVSVLFRAKSLSTVAFGEAEVPCGYGAHFEQPRTFLIFKDLPGEDDDCSATDKAYTSANPSEIFESFELDKTVSFETLSFSDVLFIPPEPLVFITPPQEGQSQATIIIKTVTGQGSASVKINSAGQITR
ncbi:hypothetical protein COS61_01515 [Candidatus Wolfebacteria bacterium CG03_land_8_20_14_0_80_40_12]|uniref:General secretion pathway GspH domain-containing protein n=1 Tax=Candidatus Wolfebacteria bacterium CG03_land_8_20_14_0_80_40_12 TaxID=1975069 RepID=A0A2M7B5M1_9BACT|nr:MAG: hypothetical protein COS61_01515 [Candidatus Wolfebacteria bacterium CG03_land_8_20_14_0_80_40_12]